MTISGIWLGTVCGVLITLLADQGRWWSAAGVALAFAHQIILMARS